MVRSTLRSRAKMWKVGGPDDDWQNLLSLLRPDTFLNSPRTELLNPGSQYWEQGFYWRTASDLEYHQRNHGGKVGSWHHERVDFFKSLDFLRVHSKEFLTTLNACVHVIRARFHSYELNPPNNDENLASPKMNRNLSVSNSCLKFPDIAQSDSRV